MSFKHNMNYNNKPFDWLNTCRFFQLWYSSHMSIINPYARFFNALVHFWIWEKLKRPQASHFCKKYGSWMIYRNHDMTWCNNIKKLHVIDWNNCKIIYMNVFFTQHKISMHIDYTINFKPTMVVILFNKVHFQASPKFTLWTIVDCHLLQLPCVCVRST
jgi:hypothetical protein